MIRLGTRGSKLALTQSEMIATQLRDLGHEVQLVILKTTGDVITGSLAQSGGDGLFTKRLQMALLENEIDLAVHSLKDLPTDDFAGLAIGAVPPREQSNDCLVVSDAGLQVESLGGLPQNFRVGTGSARRKAQLLNLRPDLNVTDIRGNVDTRIAKLDAGEFDAIVLACAGLNRLGLSDRISYRCAKQEMAPAPGQGALGLEIRSNDSVLAAAVSGIDDLATRAAVTAERQMLNSLSAGCLMPVGSVAETDEANQIRLTGVVLSPDGQRRIEATADADLPQAAELGRRVAELLLEQGAADLLSR